jgi:DNA-binding LacI/PurR family transcriptional regulator
VGFLDYYRQFRALPPQEVSRRLQAEAAERRSAAIARVPPLDLSATTWHEPPHAEAVNAATFGLRSAVHRYGDPAARAARELAAERLGVRVPEDLAVIGFDDVDLAEIVGLTTIRQPLHEGGAVAADLLLAAIEEGPGPPVERAQTLTVVERRTT